METNKSDNTSVQCHYKEGLNDNPSSQFISTNFKLASDGVYEDYDLIVPFFLATEVLVLDRVLVPWARHVDHLPVPDLALPARGLRVPLKPVADAQLPLDGGPHQAHVGVGLPWRHLLLPRSLKVFQVSNVMSEQLKRTFAVLV